MGTMTLTDDDRRLLEQLVSGPLDVSDLAVEAEQGAREAMTARLEQLADNGLVVRDDEGCWRLTESGRRALAAPGDGRRDERIDTPPDVEERLAAAGLRPDREDAVRAAFGFLRYWGTATSAELRDAIFDAWPAGYASRREWWTTCVRHHLAVLPGVDAPDGPGDAWQYVGTAEVESEAANGRWVVGDAEPDAFASARHAIETLADGEEERGALSAAFATLEADGRTTRGVLVEAVFDDHPAGFDEADGWYAWLADALRVIPGVERAADGSWCYVAGDPRYPVLDHRTNT